jgi:hypothetical protein
VHDEHQVFSPSIGPWIVRLPKWLKDREKLHRLDNKRKVDKVCTSLPKALLSQIDVKPLEPSDQLLFECFFVTIHYKGCARLGLNWSYKMA